MKLFINVPINLMMKRRVIIVKKKIKKLLILTVCMFMFFTNSAVFIASEEKVDNIVVSKNGYTFYLSETDRNEEGLVRTYSNNNTHRTSDIEETKNLLYAMGVSETVVEKFSIEELQEYANASEIITSVLYLKTDEKGNITYVDEMTALQESEIARKIEEDNICNIVNGIAPAYSDVDCEINDYMKVTFMLNGTGDTCHCVVIGEWLTMPAIRSYDSIGGCAQYMTYTPNTGECTVYYDQISTVNGNTTTTEIEKTITNIQGANESGWAGAAAVFKLPSDTVTSDFRLVHSDFTVIFQYNGKITEPDQSLNFNAIGTYTHATIGLSISPSVSIDTSGADAGIGLSIIGFKDKMSVWLEINYTP